MPEGRGGYDSCGAPWLFLLRSLLLNVLGADVVGGAAMIEGSGLNVTLREGFLRRGDDSVAII